MSLRILSTAGVSLALTGLLTAQPCVPPIIGAESGPYSARDSDTWTWSSQIFDIEQFEDASGPLLFVCGGLYFRAGGDPMTTSPNWKFPLAKLQNGAWTPIPPPFFQEPFANALTTADFSAHGGPGPSLYASLGWAGIWRWTGSEWIRTPPGSQWLLISHVDSQGPILLSASLNTIVGWRGGETWEQYAPLTWNSGGRVSRLRVLDDGTGPAVFACGTFRDTARNLRHLIKHVDGAWVQYDRPPEAQSRVTDLAFFDDGTSPSGPELYVAWIDNSSGFVSRRRNGQWEQLGSPASLDSTFVDGVSLFILETDEGPRLYRGGASSLRLWTGQGWESPIPIAFEEWLQSYNQVWTLQRADDGSGVETYIGGAFNWLQSQPPALFEGTQVHGLLRSSPEGWVSPAMGLGTYDHDCCNWHMTFRLFPALLGQTDRVVAVGNVRRAGGRFAAGLAMYDGASWDNFNAANRQFMPVAAACSPIQGEPRIVIARYTHTAPPPVSVVQWWDGVQWQSLPGSPPTHIAHLLSMNEQLFASTLSDGTFRFDQGAWVQVAPSGSNVSIVADAGQGPRLFLADGNLIHEFDGDTSLTLPAFPNGTRITSLAVHNDGSGPALYAAVPQLASKVVRLRDGIWEPVPAGLTGDQFIAIASFDDGTGPALYVAGHGWSGTVRCVITKLSGGAWRNVSSPHSTPFQPAPHHTFAVVGNRLYMGGQFSQLGTTRADHFAYIERCPPRTCTADFDGDGFPATDADIQAFFLCLAGTCCPRCTADFNNDGDTGTDADIESFFRVLAGGAC